jgi:serine/threonine-protein kinase
MGVRTVLDQAVESDAVCQPAPHAPASYLQLIDPGGATPAAAALPDVPRGDTSLFGDVQDPVRYRRPRVAVRGDRDVAHDTRTGRDVEVEILARAWDDDASERAHRLREVRLQAWLEHPSIVPIYDFGTTAWGDPFVTRKRVRGETLEEVLRGGPRDPSSLFGFTRRKLLEAFGRVCLAVDFANRRGVVHCGLKPASVLLGDYGEVYVLDWGCARLDQSRSALPRDIVETSAEEVGVGALGYAAPEQLRGEPVDARADVYALGAVLFEILTLERLHIGGSLNSILASMLGDTTDRVRAACRTARVTADLERTCLRATHLEKTQRPTSARALWRAVESVLEHG